MGERDSIHLQFSFSVGEDREKVSPYQIIRFLVACYAALNPALLVRPSVRPSHFTFLGFLRSLASLLLPKRSSDLKYGPCPPARDWGSRVSGLVQCEHCQMQKTLQI